MTWDDTCDISTKPGRLTCRIELNGTVFAYTSTHGKGSVRAFSEDKYI